MYKKAALTISHFDVEDVITTSGAEDSVPQPLMPSAPQPQPQPQPGGQDGQDSNANV